jgi:NhaA family Na+:H+ antiporter
MRHALGSTKSAKQPPIEQILLPFQEFVKAEASSGILLILATALALIWANSPWSNTYSEVWQTKLTVGLGSFELSKPLLLWINDGLMAVFFFVVGLEIKREILVGELASARKAALPVAAALGGMLAPAIIYALFNIGETSVRGWGIPMATDIAFALGILSLLGKRAPLSLKVFLTAVAIVDDIGAVLVIALFYTAQIAWNSLFIAAFFLLLLILANRLGVRRPLVYAVLGFGLWVAFLKSGVHATVAGVLLAIAIPARTRINADEFIKKGQMYLTKFERAGVCGKNILTNRRQHGALQALETACQHAETPLQRMEHTLQNWVAYAIMPIFALANAGVTFEGDIGAALTHPVTMGVFVGLIIGKQLGILLATWLAVKSNIADRPQGVSWRQIYGASWLAGVGFTMALFIGSLAFGDSQFLGMAKIGILGASLLAGFVGWSILRGIQALAVTEIDECD